MRESKVEDHLVSRIQAIGGEVRKVQWIGRRGAPDRCVMLPVCYAWRMPSRTVWVETKRPGEVPEPHQEREHKRMRAMGQTVLVLDSIEAINEAFPL